MFTRLGGAMDKDAFTEFSSVFGNKFKDYLGATYDVFRNKSLISKNCTGHISGFGLKSYELGLKALFS